jgi:predicted DCC family thiol-disulfide oxidoreductase YuxK
VEHFRGLVLFDSVCVLCDSSVRWLVDADREHRLRFAPLQGKTASEVLRRHPGAPDQLSTMVYVRGFGWGSERIYLRSDALAAILQDLGGAYQALALFRFLPRFLRDWLYDFIASHRYRWFGKLDACRLPEKGEEERFLP